MSADSTPRVRILFVCTGNTHRSVAAEAVATALVKAAGLHSVVRVESAGTNAEVGSPPDPFMVDAAAARGYDMSAMRARQVTAAQVAAATHIVGLAASHVRSLQAVTPAPQHTKMRRLLEYLPTDGGDVPDPWGGGAVACVRALALIEAGVAALVSRIAAEQRDDEAAAGSAAVSVRTAAAAADGA